MTACDRRRARTMPMRSPLMSVMPALSIATSVPVAMAIPTSAWARAGASLMPSPAMATTWPSAWRRRTTSRFCSRQHLGLDAQDAEPPRHRLGRGLAVAGQHDDLDARRRARSRAPPPVDSLIGSATPMAPAALPSTATNITVWPWLRALDRAVAQLAGLEAELAHHARIADRDALAVDDARHAASGDRGEILGRRERQAALLRRGDDGGAERMLAAALEAGGQAQRSRFSSKPRDGRVAETNCGLPSVRVPVLSTTSVSIFSRRSNASALRTSTPAMRAAPRADHDRHRRGEAERARTGDDQHGDGVDDGISERRRRARAPPTARRPRTATAMTAGTNQLATASARPWIGARLRCASLTMATILDSSMSLPTRSARMSRPPVPLTVAPVSLSPWRLVDRDRLAGDHRFVDQLVPSSTTPSTGTFSPGRTRRRSPALTSLERHVDFGAVVAHQPAPWSARGRAMRGCALPVRDAGTEAPAPRPGRRG